MGQRLPANLGYLVESDNKPRDNQRLLAPYSPANDLVVPSRQEAFGQTASEAQPCGTPVVAFAIGGLPDIVEHKGTGYLVQAFDVNNLANGILWTLQHHVEETLLRMQTHTKTVAKYTNQIVASQYRFLYERILINLDTKEVIRIN